MSGQKNCAVVGAGIIGICCGISLLEKGYSVTLYDPEPPGSMTSKGSAGGFGFTDVMPGSSPGIWKRVPGWLLDPCGPLFIDPSYMLKLLPWLLKFNQAGTMDKMMNISRALSDMLNESKSDCRKLFDKANLNHLFTELGAMTVYTSRENALKDKLEWEVKKARGVEVITLSSPQVIKEMEPDLVNANYGYYTPEWCNTTHPYQLAQALSAYFVKMGGEIKVEKIAQLEKNGNNEVRGLLSIDGQKIPVDHVIIAAGVWSKAFCHQLNDKVLLESERGYNTTLPDPGVSLKHQIIFGEEKFVISNIGSGLRIGGAAEFSGIKKPPNYKRSERLVEIARRYLPNLDDTGGEKWMGHRPATPDSLPVIGPSRQYKNVCYAFGHGHYGLTMAPTTGKMIAQMISGEPASIALTPFSIDRFN